MNSDGFEIGGICVQRGERGFVRLPVTSRLAGYDVAVPLHIVHGAQAGPVLLLMSAVHGDEHFPIRIVRDVIQGLDPKRLAGTVLAIPVANPLAFSRVSRITLEDDIDFGNMNRVFPGVRPKDVFGGKESHPTDRTVTEAIAGTISEQVLPHIQYLVDFHCNSPYGGLVMMIQSKEGGEETAERSRQITRYFNLGIIQPRPTMGTITATGYAASIGVVTAVAEIGGGSMSGPIQRKAVKIGVDGVINVLRYLQMLLGEEPVEPEPQFASDCRAHVRSTKAGYLLSTYEPDDLFRGERPGIPVKKGEVLGVLFDPYTFEEVERLVAPFDGIMYMTRRSEPVEAGMYGFGIAANDGAQWV